MGGDGSKLDLHMRQYIPAVVSSVANIIIPHLLGHLLNRLFGHLMDSSAALLAKTVVGPMPLQKSMRIFFLNYLPSVFLISF